MKKILGLVISLFMAVPMVALTTAPAQAACSPEVNTVNLYRLVDDDEVNAYAKFYNSIYFDDCGSYRILKYARIGYAPDTRYNYALSCFSTVIDKVRLNAGSITGYNPAAWTSECYGRGNFRTIDFTNRRYWDGQSGDRCFGTAVKVVKNNWPDFDYHIPQVCA